MHPQDPRRTSPIVPQRSVPRLNTERPQPAAQQAAAGIVRTQIDTIYQQNTAQQTTAAPQPAETVTPQQPADQHIAQNPYDRTHKANRTKLQAEQWKHYHSAWQDYYQQYYERYYIGEVYRMRQTLEAHTTAAPSAAIATTHSDEASRNDEAYHSLRANLLHNIRTSTIKARKSRHFMPALAFSLVLLLFLFLNYNRVLFANVEAYVSPGNIDPANIIVDPMLSLPISEEPRLVIPKINVDVPVVYDIKPDQFSQLAAMEKGIAHFSIPGASSRPGQVGNTVLSGHSSNDLFDPGDYKFIFARLDQLVVGDTFYANYLGKRYTYSITKKEVVMPTDVHKLVYDTNKKPVMTLITCVPLGTAQKRLLVTAEQVSPNPLQAEEAPEEKESPELETMPGNSPTLFSRLFG